MMLLHRSLWLLTILVASSAPVSSTVSFHKFCKASTALICRGGGGGGGEEEKVLSDIAASLSTSSSSPSALLISSDIPQAVQDFSPRHGDVAYKFLRGLASSLSFRQSFWHQQPLLLRAAATGGWIAGAFTLEDLKLVEDSYISGHCTADALRNGSQTSTWSFRSLKPDPQQKTHWSQVEKALEGGTIYFNTAGSLWPSLGGLCRLTNAAFGVPSNVNVYITPAQTTLSVPPHTDRQDVLVLQTAGTKRWRVYAPPPRVLGIDPLNRGKAGDVLNLDGVSPLLDVVLRPGDALYVPTGFPHTTDTSTVVDDSKETSESLFHETSIHLTMGLDTHVWGLTLAHLRWSLLQRCQLDFSLKIENDEAYWAAMEAIPIGFLGGEAWKRTVKRVQKGEGLDAEYLQEVTDALKKVMRKLEPSRWKDPDSMPDDTEFHQVIDYMVQQHLVELLQIQQDMFSNIDPHSDESIIKAFKGTQRQQAVMAQLGDFSKNENTKKLFEQQRATREAQLQVHSTGGNEK